MRIWDSTGVEKYDNLRQLIYIHADVFILAFSIQRPDQYKRLVHKVPRASLPRPLASCSLTSTTLTVCVCVRLRVAVDTRTE